MHEALYRPAACTPSLATMPIPRPAGPILRYLNTLPKRHHHRPFHIGAQPRNAHVAITRIHLRLRMLVAVAVPYLEDRQAGMHGGQECWRGRSAAAVVRRQQHVGRQLALRRAREQLRLLRRFDVAGQQDGMLAGRDLHGAAAGVRRQADVRMAGGQRVQHGEMHAFPGPALARHAMQIGAVRCPPRLDGRVAIEQRRGQPAHLHVLQQRNGAARVIEVAVRDDHAVELADAARPQIRHDDPAGAVGIEAVGRSRVVQQAVIVGFHQHGHALSHVKGRDPHLARRRAGRQGRQQR